MSIQLCEQKVRQLAEDLRTEISDTEDIQGKAVLETVAEVLQGAAKALEHCRQEKEAAFKA